MALGGKVHAWLKSLYSTAPMFELINGSLNRWGPNIFLDSQTFRRCLICMNKISPSTFKSLFLKFPEMPNTKSHGAWSLRLKNAGMKRLEVNHWHIHSLIDKAFTHISIEASGMHTFPCVDMQTHWRRPGPPLILQILPGHASSCLLYKEGVLFWGAESELQDLVQDALIQGGVVPYRQRGISQESKEHNEKTNSSIIQPSDAPWLQATPIGCILHLC